MPASKSLVAKLAEVLGDVERVPKSGYNDFHKYSFATEADIVAAVRKGMSTHGLIMVPSVEDVTWRDGKSAPIATTRVRFTIMDGDSDASLSFVIVSEGQDSGDKALYKALTGATKYALLKLFLIPTGDDPEHETAQRGEAPHKAAQRRGARGDYPQPQPLVEEPSPAPFEYQPPNEDSKIAAERATKLKELKALADAMKLLPEARATWWTQFCGNAKPNAVDPAALADLVKALRKHQEDKAKEAAA